MQNSFVLSLARFLFDNSRHHESSHHGNYFGVKAHENGIFLYKSMHGDAMVRSRITDYLTTFGLIGFVTGVNQFLWIPVLYTLVFMPRKLLVLEHFTFHAELLPHTEQVVFHKASFFGSVRRITVDIKNLEKINAEILPGKIV